MNENTTQLIGFQDDAGLGELFETLGVFSDYTSLLPEHLTQILGKQHPGVVIDSIELRGEPKTRVGGLPSEEDESKIVVQDMDATLPLGLNLRVGSTEAELNIRLAIKITEIHITPIIETDMFVED